MRLTAAITRRWSETGEVAPSLDRKWEEKMLVTASYSSIFQESYAPLRAFVANYPFWANLFLSGLFLRQSDGAVLRSCSMSSAMPSILCCTDGLRSATSF